jgi:hypothetical protein
MTLQTGGLWDCLFKPIYFFQAAEETKKKMPGRAAETISIIHFNDVYNVESREVNLMRLSL